MLGFFRRLINSKVGIIVTFITLGIIALAFAAGDVSNIRNVGLGALSGNDVATIGKTKITVDELRQRAQQEIDQARQQQPGIDAKQYLAAGGLEAAVQQLITTVGLAEFGRENGMVVSKRLVDGQIASIPALQGPNGKFDETLYRRILAERRLTDAQIRQDIARDVLVRQLTAPTIGATTVGQQLALPYASLLLEKRAGEVGIVPVSALPQGPAPTAQEIQSFYGRNLARYRVPERRTIRYAVVTPAQLAAQSIPTEAEIAQAYQKNRADYQATEKRVVTQVTLADQASADALATKVRGGTSIADAARAVGLEASTLPALDKAGLAAQASPALADAAFAAAKGAVVGPVRGAIGFVVARVDSIDQVAGRSLDQVRAQLTADLAKQKTQAALAALHDKLDDALSGGATFDEVIADAKLSPKTSPALAQGAVDPLNPAAKPDPALVPLIAAGFAADDGDAPQLVQTGTDGSFAVVALGQTQPAAPRPLADVRNQVVADLIADRRRQSARTIANAVLAKVKGGMSLAQALRASGASLPAPQPVNASRADVLQAQGRNPALALLFSVPQGQARLLEAPGDAGWLIVKTDRIERGNAAGNAAAIAAARGGLSRSMGGEYAEQFARAARAAIGTKVDQRAIARVRADLAGDTPAGAQ
ncbi:peptidyl-prolyl cis-trans isomerase D [Sphingomonas sp. SORGH_AS802]|uniref:peptidylprolyl isomerase n=1 Tax=unclassified Sphingomonas TaxID=196159 RepID=UPI002856B7F9|nr:MULTISPECIES: SurA N-terminal domain-containing protein [unclassified Sphingomonas]MDR6127411.1 peptidyl-prolyl cis-trans isomerase D [Sphingomonas sp. SORGH_AS_0438]MDR6133677.1 peptidyl-prolyl cis-trans isomerase D [Sphingomonas sp. SORGH_AS_0802]